MRRLTLQTCVQLLRIFYSSPRKHDSRRTLLRNSPPGMRIRIRASLGDVSKLLRTPSISSASNALSCQSKLAYSLNTPDVVVSNACALSPVLIKSVTLACGCRHCATTARNCYRTRRSDHTLPRYMIRCSKRTPCIAGPYSVVAGRVWQGKDGKMFKVYCASPV